MSKSIRPIAFAALSLCFVAAISSTNASASDFGVSIGINRPAPVYYAPRYYAPAPVYTAPVYSAPVYSAPVYSAPACNTPTYYSAPAPVYYSAPVVYERPVYYSAPVYSRPYYDGYGRYNSGNSFSFSYRR